MGDRKYRLRALVAVASATAARQPAASSEDDAWHGRDVECAQTDDIGATRLSRYKEGEITKSGNLSLVVAYAEGS